MKGGIKYDDASWHFGGDFPADLPPEAGGTHIGMFVAWAMLTGLAGEIHTKDSAEMLAKLSDRALAPGAWFIAACDEKFTDEDLNQEGNEFALSYYADKDGLKTTTPSYLNDYENAFPDSDDLYRIPNTWETYQVIAPIISRRFIKWRNSQKGWKRFIPTIGRA